MLLKKKEVFDSNFLAAFVGLVFTICLFRGLIGNVHFFYASAVSHLDTVDFSYIYHYRGWFFTRSLHYLIVLSLLKNDSRFFYLKALKRVLISKGALALALLLDVLRVHFFKSYPDPYKDGVKYFAIYLLTISILNLYLHFKSFPTRTKYRVLFMVLIVFAEEVFLLST